MGIFLIGLALFGAALLINDAAHIDNFWTDLLGQTGLVIVLLTVILHFFIVSGDKQDIKDYQALKEATEVYRDSDVHYETLENYYRRKMKILNDNIKFNNKCVGSFFLNWWGYEPYTAYAPFDIEKELTKTEKPQQ